MVNVQSAQFKLKAKFQLIFLDFPEGIHQFGALEMIFFHSFVQVKCALPSSPCEPDCLMSQESSMHMNITLVPQFKGSTVKLKGPVQGCQITKRQSKCNANYLTCITSQSLVVEPKPNS